MKKILCIHGVGGMDMSPNQWIPAWKSSLARFGPGFQLNFCFMKMDDLFRESRYRLGGIRYIEAVSAFIDAWIDSIQKETISLVDYSEVIRWTAGMPAQFLTDTLLRERLRYRLAAILLAYRPDLVYAHSLGTLVVYDLLRDGNPTGKDPCIVLTSGTQLGHPAVAALFGRNLRPMQASLWVNLHNPKDRVFAFRPVALKSPGFLEVETPFEKRILNHAALSYLNHPNTGAIPWRLLWKDPLLHQKWMRMEPWISPARPVR